MKKKTVSKTYHLTPKHPTSETPPLQLVLTSPNRRGYCFRCQLTKEIKVISESPLGLAWDIKEFCYTCALINLTELKYSDYQFKNKSAVIKEIRETLINQQLENYEQS